MMIQRVAFLAGLLGLGSSLSLLSCGGTTVTTSSTTGSGGGATTTTGAGGASVSSSSSGSTTGTGGASVSSSSSGSTTTSSSSSSSTSGGGCGDCGGFQCCGSSCINPKNDIHNCGACGTVCPGPNPYCDDGNCGKAPCAPGQACDSGKLCCGDSCCTTGELCCVVPGPVVMQYPSCTPPSPEGTCPKGCLQCVCASPDTPIATPSGSRPIAELAPGDLVYSMSGQAIVAVPILRVNKVPARDHHVVRVSLETGAVLEISPRHPTADGRTFADLHPGDRLDGARIVAVELIPYTHPFTHDILPASDTGTYFAGGELIGSTLFGPVNVGPFR
ncbi:MAG: hypothetical protein ABI193_08240 [Minicystis sp.]